MTVDLDVLLDGTISAPRPGQPPYGPPTGPPPPRPDPAPPTPAR